MNNEPISYLNINEINSETITLIQNDLADKGYSLSRPDFLQNQDVSLIKSKFHEICKHIGTPISHDSDGSIIWDIKSNASSNNLIKTYSEHSHEAELHTDSQYSHYPEDYFGMVTLKKANCGGGLSSLLNLNDLLQELRALPSGRETEKILRDTKFPFVVPNVFKKSNSEEREYNFGPILRDNEIRFRVDTFEKAVQERPNLCTPTQLTAFETFKKCILTSPSIKKFYLEDGDLIFINNKTMLHGRSSFTDPNRHLLRIRMNKKQVQ